MWLRLINRSTKLNKAPQAQGPCLGGDVTWKLPIPLTIGAPLLPGRNGFTCQQQRHGIIAVSDHQHGGKPAMLWVKADRCGERDTDWVTT